MYTFKVPREKELPGSSLPPSAKYDDAEKYPLAIWKSEEKNVKNMKKKTIERLKFDTWKELQKIIKYIFELNVKKEVRKRKE